MEMDLEVLRSRCISQYKRLMEEIDKQGTSVSEKAIYEFTNNVNNINDPAYLNNMLQEMRAEEDKLFKERLSNVSKEDTVSDAYRNDPDFIEGRFTIIARAQDKGWTREELIEKLTAYEQGWASSDVLPELKGNTK